MSAPVVGSVLDGHAADTRRTDPVTSHEARDSSNAAASLGAVLSVLRDEGPLTDEELVWAMETAHVWGRVPRFTPQRIRTARHHLVERGEVADAGVYRLTATGRRAKVWRVVA